MRKEEETSAELFKKHLQKEYADVNYRSGSDPPDIVFEINGCKWAVEHTRLFQYVDEGGKTLSRVGVDKSIINLEKQINNRINKNLNSSWIISIDTPIKKNELKIIEDRILEMIHKNLGKSSFKHSNGKIYIQKIDELNKPLIFISIPSPSSTIPQSDQLTCDIQGQIDFAIKKILTDKCAKIKKL